MYRAFWNYLLNIVYNNNVNMRSFSAGGELFIKVSQQEKSLSKFLSSRKITQSFSLKEKFFSMAKLSQSVSVREKFLKISQARKVS